MSNDEHKKTVSKYLQSHRNPPAKILRNEAKVKPLQDRTSSGPTRCRSETRTPDQKTIATPTTTHGGARPKVPVKHARNKILENKLAAMKNWKPTMEYMPDEILLHIFSFLPINAVVKVGRVCRRWQNLSNDNMLWHTMYRTHGKQSREKRDKSPARRPTSYWKAKCVQIIQRDAQVVTQKILTTLKKIQPFTGLPTNTQTALKKSGQTFQLSLIDSRGIEHTYLHSDVFYFSMAACARWYTLTDCPSLHSIKKLRLFSSNPMFFNGKGVALPKSPCQRSILYSVDLNWRNFQSVNSPAGQDDTVNMYALPDGIIVATWKDGGELAFVVVGLHFHYLVHRCLRGNSSIPYMPTPHRPLFSDIDPKYGLHSYKCTMELRNQRTSMWTEQFTNMDSLPDFKDGFALFQLIDPDRSFQRSWVEKDIIFPWRTDVLRGKVKNVAIMDITVLDDQDKPMWCGCGSVYITSPGSDKVDYEYEGDYFQLKYEDTFGRICMSLVWEPQNKKYYMTSLLLSMSLQCINSWFGTRH